MLFRDLESVPIAEKARDNPQNSADWSQQPANTYNVQYSVLLLSWKPLLDMNIYLKTIPSASYHIKIEIID